MSPIVQPNLASREFKANPHPFYARLRADAPVYRAKLPNGQPTWLISRYDDVLAVLKDERLIKNPLTARSHEQQAKQPWMPGLLKPLARNMLDLDGADHARLRMLVHKGFTPRRVEALRARIQGVCNDLLHQARQRGQLDLIRDYALPLPVTIISELLGVPPQDRARFAQWSKRAVSASTATDLLLALPGLWQFSRFLRDLFKQRRRDPQDDLITALVQAEEAGDRLSEDELLAMVFILLVAGHETTVNLIGGGALALIQHPDQLERLRTNPGLGKTAIEELLRYVSPVDMATERYAREDVTLHGLTIPKGEQVLGIIGSANRDERQFTHPDTLDLTREPNRHLALGQGIHYCLGAPLARLEGQIAIQTLLQEMPHLQVVGGSETLRWRKGVFLRGLERLPLRSNFVPTAPSPA